jgi:phosphatidate phosphatase PAH1
MPHGPLFLSTCNLINAFIKEVIKKNSHNFKIQILQYIVKLFNYDINEKINPFIAGFGNKHTDIVSLFYIILKI